MAGKLESQRTHMKSNTRWMGAFAAVLIAGACLNGALNSLAASSQEADEAKAMISSYDTEQRAAANARAKDAAWKPACNEVGVIKVGDGRNAGALKSFCLNTDGNILVCYAPTAGK